jgi:hypothetical protein
MRRNPASKTKFKNNIRKATRKIKNVSFLIFLVASIFLSIGYFFIQPLIENSFIFAKGGIGQDFNSANKYTLLLVNKDSLDEVREVNMIVFDKLNKKIFDFYFNVDEESFIVDDRILGLRNSFRDSSNKEISQDEFVSYFERNFGIIIDLTMVLPPEEFAIYQKAVLGDLNLREIYDILKIDNLGRRNLLLMYSYSRGVSENFNKRINVTSSLQLDRELSSIFLDSDMGSEKKSIAIVNGTKINGLGKKTSRYVNNMGGRVVSLTSREVEIQQSSIIYKEYSQSLENLSKILGIQKIEKYNEENINLNPETVKADLVIILGNDFREAN